MVSTDLNTKTSGDFDPLDMHNYRLEKFKKIEKTGFERWMEILGGPLAILSFILIYYFASISYLNHINPEVLKPAGAKRLTEMGAANFTRINYAMLAIFVASIILWITEAIPNYLTSLFVILAMVLTGVTSETVA